MPFINVGSGNDLILELPTDRTQVWGTRFKTNFATPIAEHNHTGSGNGRKLGAGSFSADSITDVEILLSNNSYLRGRNAADSADVNIIKVNASDKLETEVDFAALGMINNTYFTSRNQADSADIDIVKVNATDKIELGADLANPNVITNTYFQSRNNADTGYISLIKSNASDKLEFGVDLVNANILTNTYFKSRNNADSGYIDLLKANTSDQIEFGTDTVHTGSITIQDYFKAIDVTFSLANNQTIAANITNALVTEAEGYSFVLYYSIYVDATTDLVEKGKAEFTYVNGVWAQTRSYSGTNSQVIFSIVTGQLKYTTPVYTGFSAVTLTYNVTEY